MHGRIPVSPLNRMRAGMLCHIAVNSLDDLDLKGYFYHDRKREADELSDFHRKLSEKNSGMLLDLSMPMPRFILS